MRGPKSPQEDSVPSSSASAPMESDLELDLEGGIDNQGYENDGPVQEQGVENVESVASVDSPQGPSAPEPEPDIPPPDYEDIAESDNARRRSNLPSTLGPDQISSDAQSNKKEDVPRKSSDANGRPITMWTDPEDPGQPEGGESDGRDVWDNPIEFLLSCISMSVGLGNVWRFPFVAYANGGGAFLIPYLIVLLLIGRPIYYLEMCLGQFSRFGQVKVWNMAPLFKGVGYGSMLGTICVVSYYCSIMAQTVFYFGASFSADLPWSVCDKKWGGDLCLDNGTVNNEITNQSVSELYYILEAFPQKTNVDDGIGTPEWRLTLCLLFAWIMIFLSLWKGVKSSGKVAYFTAIFPYVVMLILLIRGVTLEGAGKGIMFFIEPQWDKIYEPKVWYEAVSQCFFSLSTGFGPIIMFSSYNPFRHNVYRDALIISFMDTFTSLLAGCTIFAVLGYLSESTGQPIEAVASGGPGLAFVSYPEAITHFPVPQLFAVLFFLMLFTLGIGSATSLAGGIITIICDQFPKWIRWQVTLVVCVIGFCSGLMYVTPGGPFMVDLINEHGANFVIYVMAMIEVAAVSWVYGLGNFCRDIEFMLGRKVGWYWKFCWGFFIPCFLAVILGYYLVTREEFVSGGGGVSGVSYPNIAHICGWLLSAFALLILPGFALHAVLTRKAVGISNKFWEALKPTRHWGPQSYRLRKEWNMFKRIN